MQRRAEGRGTTFPDRPEDPATSRPGGAFESSPPSAGSPDPPLRTVEAPSGPVPHGSRLASAFLAMEAFPALRESRDRLRRAVDREPLDRGSIVEIAETDLGFGLAVLRAAARLAEAPEGAASIAAAVGSLDRVTLHVLVESLETVDPLGDEDPWTRAALAHRRHVLGVRSALVDLTQHVDGLPIDLLCTAALLHDVGKLVLLRVHPSDTRPYDPRATAGARLAGERRSFGVDHPTVGAVLLRRWRLPAAVVRLVERHHDPDGDRALTALELADLIAHDAAGDAIATADLAHAAGVIGVDRGVVRALLHDQTPGAPARSGPAVPSPLSRREADVVVLLAEGRSYTGIADALGITVSTARSHLHRIYRKLGVGDRAQAVLLATANGWVDGPHG